MDQQFKERMTDSLVWLPERGVGYFPVREEDEPYDDSYFQKYQGYAATPMGEAITRFRVGLVNKYTDGEVVDIGIGCGSFVEGRGNNTYGYDIMPAAVQWLEARGVFRDPYRGETVPSITCWDSLEHLPKPHELLSRVTEYVFVSLPVFTGPDDVLSSKHYRKDEHRWYFTSRGLAQWMARYGFAFVEQTNAETMLGREGIETHVYLKTQ